MAKEFTELEKLTVLEKAVKERAEIMGTTYKQLSINSYAIEALVGGRERNPRIYVRLDNNCVKIEDQIMLTPNTEKIKDDTLLKIYKLIDKIASFGNTNTRIYIERILDTSVCAVIDRPVIADGTKKKFKDDLHNALLASEKFVEAFTSNFEAIIDGKDLDDVLSDASYNFRYHYDRYLTGGIIN